MQQNAAMAGNRKRYGTVSRRIQMPISGRFRITSIRLPISRGPQALHVLGEHLALLGGPTQVGDDLGEAEEAHGQCDDAHSIR
jgi:hypothetical protein